MAAALPPKWCPQCRDEFIHSMERCPTCEVPLVADLSAVPEVDPSTRFVKDWASDLDRKAAEEQRQREQWNEAEGCPACQTIVDLSAAECSECGLVFVEAEE